MRYYITPSELKKKQNIESLTAADNTVQIPSETGITKEQLAKLEAALQAKVVYPWSPGYDDDKREFNDVYPANPLLIVYVANYQDIQVCLEFARNYKLTTAIRSGRHSLADYSVCDGMVIDISLLKSVFVDTANQTVWVQAGITFADLNPALEFYGMHLPGGGCPTVSVAGYMQGGGYGLTSRNFGIQSDCVLEFTMILADGSLVIVNTNQNSDLFWAVRGGTGGNFGVLVSIKYKIFPLGLIWGISIAWDFETDTNNAAQALHVIQENYLTGFKYPNLGIETLVYTDIAGDGHKKVRFGGGFIGDEDQLNAAIAPLMAVPGATVVFKQQGKYSYVNNKVLEGIPAIPEKELPTIKFYGRSTYISRSLSVNDYKNILQFFKTVPNTYGMLDLEGYGGAINQYPVEQSAFIHRNAIMDFYCIVFFDKVTNDQEKNKLWIISLFEFVEQYSNGHSYQNYPNRDQAGFQWAYWGPYYYQLVTIKQKYDPNNFFHYQQSIAASISPEFKKKQIALFDNNPIIRENF
jgi:FAD/FMN-containing dehydrogenase